MRNSAKLLALAALAPAMLALGSPGAAATNKTGASAKNVVADAAHIAKILQSVGYKAEIDTDETDGSPFISSASGGYPFAVFFFGCDDNGNACKTVQFYAGFASDDDPSLSEMNQYAKDCRWGRVYIDNEGDPVIEMDIDLEDGGMSEELFKDNVEYWDLVMNNFAKFAFGPERPTCEANS